MHASIAVFVMMLGGPICPEPEITTIPLKDDLSNQTSAQNIQNLERQEYTNRVKLPPAPTVEMGPGDSGVQPQRNPYSPTNPGTYQRRPPTIPDSPTSPQSASNGQQGYAPGHLGNGGYGAGGNANSGGYGNTGGYPSGVPRNDLGNGSAVGRNAISPPVGGGSGQYAAPTAIAPPTTATYTNSPNNSVSGLTSQYGLTSPQYPTMANPSTGTAPKAYDNYQAPSGYSPWMNLYQPTNNGTLSAYTAYVQPAQSQQNFNSRVSAQINGVQTMQRNYNSGTPGMEVNVGGNGMANPAIFQNYKGYYPSSTQGPLNPYGQ